MTTPITKWAWCAILATVLGACASGPSVHPQIAETTGAVRAAEEMGAKSLPEASLHLKLAHESVQDGNALLQDGEEDAARRAFERAQMDAELAIALIKEDEAQKGLLQSEQELHDLNATR